MTDPIESKLMRGPRAHSVTWELNDDWISGKVICHAGPGADCRMWCPQGCESWHLIEHEHKLVDYGQCMAAEWIDNAGVQESHVGSHAPADGHILVEWDDDGFVWSYADD